MNFFNPLIKDLTSHESPQIENHDNEDFIPKEFKNLMNSFFGCTAGNIKSPIWFCGLEWGGGYDSELPILLDTLQPYGFSDLHTWNADSFRKSFWASGSPFCQNVIKLLVGLQQGYYQTGDNKKEGGDKSWFEDLARRRIVGPNGLALIFNMFPISIPNRSAYENSWNSYKVRKNDGTVQLMTEWSGLKDFQKYLEAVIKFRSDLFIKTRKQYEPKLIVCFGKNSENEFLKLWGADEGICENKEINTKDINLMKGQISFKYKLLEEKTLLVIAPFPANPGGINSDEKINKISSAINKLCCGYFGDNWLGNYKNPEQYEPDAQLVNAFTKLCDLKETIDDFKASINQICTNLEKIDSVKRKLQENHEGYSIQSIDYSALEKQIANLKSSFWGQLHDFDDIRGKIEEEIKNVEKELWASSKL